MKLITVYVSVTDGSECLTIEGDLRLLDILLTIVCHPSISNNNPDAVFSSLIERKNLNMQQGG